MAKHRHFVRLMVAVALICAAGSAAFGAVSTEYLGDAVSYLGNDFKGSWVGNVGIDGYQLLNWNGNNNSSLYPSYLGTAQAGPGIAQHMWTGAAASSEARVVQGAPPNEGQRSSATWYTGSNPAYIRIPVLQDANFILGVYMFDFEGGRSGEIGVTDLSTETSPAVMINQGVYQQGKWNFFAVTATAGDTISIKLNALVSNCTASMLSFDPPAGTRVSSVWITLDCRTRCAMSSTRGAAIRAAASSQAHIVLRAMSTPLRA